MLNCSIGVNLIKSLLSLYLNAKYESAANPSVVPHIAKSKLLYKANKLVKLRTIGVKFIYIASKSLTYVTLKNENRQIKLYTNTIIIKLLWVSLNIIPIIEKQICMKITATANICLLNWSLTLNILNFQPLLNILFAPPLIKKVGSLELNYSLHKTLSFSLSSIKLSIFYSSFSSFSFLKIVFKIDNPVNAS